MHEDLHTSVHELPKHVSHVIRLVGRKWALDVLHTLAHDPLTFGELKKRVNGISASVLSDLLSEFQEKNIIEKRTVNPPHHTYFIGDFGNLLCEIVDRLDEFGTKVMDMYPNKAVIDQS